MSIPVVAIVGRPNVGKSSLLNRLLGEQRVIVSDVPGTTRDAIDTAIGFDGLELVLIDTAGIRRRGKIKPGVEKHSFLRAIKAVNRADVCLLLLDANDVVAAFQAILPAQRRFDAELVTNDGSGVYDQSTFRAFVGPDRKLPPPGFVKIVKADEAGRACFAFMDLPKGDYLIVVFADENNNGKLDRNTWGNPVEPTCSYKASKAFFWDWNDQKFEVDKDTSGLVLSFSE